MLDLQDSELNHLIERLFTHLLREIRCFNPKLRGSPAIDHAVAELALNGRSISPISPIGPLSPAERRIRFGERRTARHGRRDGVYARHDTISMPEGRLEPRSDGNGGPVFVNR